MAVMEGFLSKWTNVMKGWQYRWFVLDENAGILSYYTSKEKMMRGVRRGCVRLKGAIIGIDDEDDSTFTITVDHKTFHFQARDEAEREKWVRALEDTILRHTGMIPWDIHRPPPNIRDFDNKVSEADAYLQIMIEQTKKLEERMQNLTDSDEKTTCEIILTHANAMLDNIKHSIVLLQIAKNTAHPVNGIYQASGQSLNLSTSINSDSTTPLTNSAPVQAGIEVGSECTENRQSNLLTAASNMALVVPYMSYSSSEGEDDFFDANDSMFTPSSQTPVTLRQFSIEESSSLPSASPTVPNVSNEDSSTAHPDNNIDYDAIYDDNEESDVCSMENHGSVISHLLSQVKIGMDLTKVVLPTFILERRSLLEMYADYFAHPDLFLKIADLKDPRDRMVQVVKWYLSSYHAGRKSSVAKKPYNPVLGEVFRCHWNVSDESPSTPDSEEFVKDGPIPWCDQNQLTFVAEQVSHHPPKSAFYAEHYKKRIFFNAHVYTKSKFLGLSVCVQNIGQGVVSVMDYNEDYIVTFPNGYGRSILTIPWIELGGSVTITCQKTGYHCNIEFMTKPFYANKKHKITADVFGPGDKKPFLSINGEWNGIMEANWADKEHSEVFIDVNKLSIVKKVVRPIIQQEENESRRLWKEVTAGLKLNDIKKATNAKEQIEQRQRDEAKERSEKNEKWETKMFKPAGDYWLYTKPLLHRLTLLQATKNQTCN